MCFLCTIATIIVQWVSSLGAHEKKRPGCKASNSNDTRNQTNNNNNRKTPTANNSQHSVKIPNQVATIIIIIIIVVTAILKVNIASVALSNFLLPGINYYYYYY